MTEKLGVGGCAMCGAAYEDQVVHGLQADRDFQVLAITVAYEQGFGKGARAKRINLHIEMPNPYEPGDCHAAWALGYKNGFAA